MLTKLISTAALALAIAAPLCAVAPNTVIKTIAVGVSPSGVAITPNGQYAYVVNLSGNTVSVIRISDQSLYATIADASLNGPYSVTIDPTGTYAYVTNSNTTTITVIEIASNTVYTVLTGFDGPDGMVITPDNRYGYVAEYGTSSSATVVDVVNLGTGAVGPSISVGDAVAAIAMTKNGSTVYAGNYNNGIPGVGSICVIATASNTVTGTMTGFFGPYTIALTPDNQHAYVTNFGNVDFVSVGDTVSVLNLSSNTVTDTITVGTQPAGVAVTPDGLLAYVTLYNDQNSTPSPGEVKVIDTSTNTLTSTVIPVGQGPAQIAITPNGEFAYVTNYIDNTVSVIALPSFQIFAQGTPTRSRFPLQIDLINRITWTVEGSSLPVRYTIYRDPGLTEVAAVIPGGCDCCLEFLDHNRRPCVPYTYYIVGTNSAGTTSDPVVVVVQQP